ncbi:ankyrin repeat domain-containing protein SOWAHC-like [Gouania willdenowi]|uniref:ankyrin repeat domain-containing protein SOWAHC-like n=1 Tax=Gouania willdenowi TaxID=441366 RepID=UPI0010564AB6|nr:ankyrin repeat domain-containing protein SOWAHC-like [Gouania willdenowi]
MEFTEEHIVDFLRMNGGKVMSSVLLEHFKTVFPAEPELRAAVRAQFKSCVDRVAFVKSGTKYVCLRKKFLINPLCETAPETEHVSTEQAESAGSDVTPPPPVSETGSDRQRCVPHVFLQLPENRNEQSKVDDNRTQMGNIGSCRQGKPRVIPQITVIQASPLPDDGTVFNMPQPAATGSTGLSNAGTTGSGSVSGFPRGTFEIVISEPGEDEENINEVCLDTDHLSGSGRISPRESRKHFIEVMMNSSADVKRLTRCDSDVSSLVSSTLEEDRTLVTLDPVEHEWMLCSSDSEWSSLQRLLVTEPSLVLRKDFVTGFTCLHWAAKHGKPELIAMIVNFAKQHHVPISVDVRSNTGYTPLHIAAMHGHMEVVKLLVGAFNADVEIRDYSGKKACQYLTNSASLDIRDIVGAYETQETDDSHHKDTPRWKLAQILQANLKPTWMLNSEDCVPADREGGPREVLLRRKSSLSIMKPKFQRIRQRTSQLVHSTSFGEKKEGERAKRHSFLSRPKTHWFG